MIRSEVEALINTNLEDFSNIVPEKHREVAAMFIKAYPYPGEHKNITMLTSNITIYFDTTGLGRVGKEYEGWAIRNGNNTTDNAGGLVDIGYDPLNYPVLGATGGEKTHTLTHNEIPLWKTLLESGAGGSSAADYSDDGNGTTTPTAFSIMQPYRVVLKLMSL
jgi:hypothetical protein